MNGSAVYNRISWEFYFALSHVTELVYYFAINRLHNISKQLYYEELAFLLII